MKTAFDKFFDPDDNGTHWDTWKAAWQAGYEACKSEAAPSQESVYQCPRCETSMQVDPTAKAYTTDAAAQIVSLQMSLAEWVTAHGEQAKQIAELEHNWQLTYDKLWDEAEEMNRNKAQKIVNLEQQIAKLEAQLSDAKMALEYVKQSVFEDSAAFDIAKTALRKLK